MLTTRKRHALELMRANHAGGLVFAAKAVLPPSLRQIVPRLRAKGLIGATRYVPVAINAAIKAKPRAGNGCSSPNAWKATRKAAFIAGIYETGTIAGAIAAIGLSPKTKGGPYAARAADAEFRAAWDAALTAVREAKSFQSLPATAVGEADALTLAVASEPAPSVATAATDGDLVIGADDAPVEVKPDWWSPAFEAQMERIRQGEKVVAKPVIRRVLPERTLGGVASGML